MSKAYTFSPEYPQFPGDAPSCVRFDGRDLTVTECMDRLNRLAELEQACKAMVKHEGAILWQHPRYSEEIEFAEAWQRMVDCLKGGAS